MKARRKKGNAPTAMRICQQGPELDKEPKVLSLQYPDSTRSLPPLHFLPNLREKVLGKIKVGRPNFMKLRTIVLNKVKLLHCASKFYTNLLKPFLSLQTWLVCICADLLITFLLNSLKCSFCLICILAPNTLPIV